MLWAVCVCVRQASNCSLLSVFVPFDADNLLHDLLHDLRYCPPFSALFLHDLVMGLQRLLQRTGHPGRKWNCGVLMELRDVDGKGKKGMTGWRVGKWDCLLIFEERLKMVDGFENVRTDDDTPTAAAVPANA
ncbi:hypothetical protein SLEP1_g38358 [Rubroshorea leprosula]|nr:hypothetical protein SLEP1_g38358 [Rubroshorea leprosula]